MILREYVWAEGVLRSERKGFWLTFQAKDGITDTDGEAEAKAQQAEKTVWD